uniref:Uncharacterized protein n=1 Tax=Timema poppense TaxID=170557 RepID=A0A7R9D4N3_TIMPO|nr:unnamed protein product [Timema poppensis]
MYSMSAYSLYNSPAALSCAVCVPTHYTTHLLRYHVQYVCLHTTQLTCRAIMYNMSAYSLYNSPAVLSYTICLPAHYTTHLLRYPKKYKCEVKENGPERTGLSRSQQSQSCRNNLCGESKSLVPALLGRVCPRLNHLGPHHKLTVSHEPYRSGGQHCVLLPTSYYFTDNWAQHIGCEKHVRALERAGDLHERRTQQTPGQGEGQLQSLMDFLLREVKQEEGICLAVKGFNISGGEEVVKGKRRNIPGYGETKIFTAAALGKRGSRTVRALIDMGSQRSYILKEVVGQMGYTSIGEERIQHALFGGNQSERKYLCQRELQLLGIEINDEVGPVQVLLGADFAGKILTGERVLKEQGLKYSELRQSDIMICEIISLSKGVRQEKKANKEASVQTTTDTSRSKINKMDVWYHQLLELNIETAANCGSGLTFLLPKGKLENNLGKTTLCTSNRDSNTDLPVFGSPVYCESDALDHAATEVGHGPIVCLTTKMDAEHGKAADITKSQSATKTGQHRAKSRLHETCQSTLAISSSLPTTGRMEPASPPSQSVPRYLQPAAWNLPVHPRTQFLVTYNRPHGTCQSTLALSSSLPTTGRMEPASPPSHSVPRYLQPAAWNLPVHPRTQFLVTYNRPHGTCQSTLALSSSLPTTGRMEPASPPSHSVPRYLQPAAWNLPVHPRTQFLVTYNRPHGTCQSTLALSSSLPTTGRMEPASPPSHSVPRYLQPAAWNLPVHPRTQFLVTYNRPHGTCQSTLALSSSLPTTGRMEPASPPSHSVPRYLQPAAWNLPVHPRTQFLVTYNRPHGTCQSTLALSSSLPTTGRMEPASPPSHSVPRYLQPAAWNLPVHPRTQFLVTYNRPHGTCQSTLALSSSLPTTGRMEPASPPSHSVPRYLQPAAWNLPVHPRTQFLVTYNRPHGTCQSTLALSSSLPTTGRMEPASPPSHSVPRYLQPAAWKLPVHPRIQFLVTYDWPIIHKVRNNEKG